MPNKSESIERLATACVLSLYASTKCDFLDCYLAALAAASGDHVATIDKDFNRFDDVKRWDHATEAG